MTEAAIAWAFRVRTGSPTVKSVLVLLTARADPTGFLRATVDDIAREAELSSRTVRSAFRKLRDTSILRDVTRGVFWLPELAPGLAGWSFKRSFVFARDRHACIYCGDATSDLQCDHVVPRSRGGTDDLWNLVACCGPCNASKGNRTLSEWKVRVR